MPNYSADKVHQNGMEYSVNDQSTSSTMVPTTVHQLQRANRLRRPSAAMWESCLRQVRVVLSLAP